MGVSGVKLRGMLATGDRPGGAADARRQMLADWCKLMGARLNGQLPAASDHATPHATPPKLDPLAGVHLSRRERQILTCLLGGDSEKQVALKLTISPHTVHTYVKKLHKTLGVASRGELMARFVSA